MSFMKTNTVDIEIDGIRYNSKKDFGLAIENTDYLGEAVQDESNLIYVPGRSGPLDFTESIFGEQYYQYREIGIKFGGVRKSELWDAEISRIRNLFDGRIVKLWFQTDPEWYWKGRVKISNFKHVRNLGTFEFHIPRADPYKYRDRKLQVKSTAAGIKVVCDNARKPVLPTFTTTASITVKLGTASVTMMAGTHTDNSLKFAQGRNELTIIGASTVTVEYTEGSL